ncbi:MAG: hypothetical protein HY057_03075 [Rhodospirillales bacterium]|nr:hypothetical protein [Rhodospirillales bacterium]
MAVKRKRPAKAKRVVKKKKAAAKPRITALAASQVVKKAAEAQKITVELTPEQAEAILRPWDRMDPKKPAQVTFVVQGREISGFAVAAYRYRGNTCCV